MIKWKSHPNQQPVNGGISVNSMLCECYDVMFGYDVNTPNSLTIFPAVWFYSVLESVHVSKEQLVL